ncbi:hypothetical protein R1sor_006807 [Riccia sorocarpa]|uniref:Replitron HUH endonuclease domain-containing protein n=1 Tax=Riccia sorocarpa TaxID=122646 RepID=A0ABD3HQR9_9MARC
MIKILYADNLPVYPIEKASRCSGAANNLSSAEWRCYEEREDYYVIEPTYVAVEWINNQQVSSIGPFLFCSHNDHYVQLEDATGRLFTHWKWTCRKRAGIWEYRSTAISVWCSKCACAAAHKYKETPNHLPLIRACVLLCSTIMTYATVVSGTPKNVRELKRAARKPAPKQAEPPPLKKTTKVPAKATRKKPEAKLQQVSITVGIVGDDITQETFADMKRFMDNRATVGLIALERGDATLQLHIQGVLALMSTSTKAVKQDIMEAIGWKSNCPLGGAVCVKALTNKGIHTLVGICTKDQQELHYQMHSVNVSPEQMEEGKRRYLIFGACNFKNRVELSPYNLLIRAMQYRRYRAKNPLSITFRGCLRKMLLTGQYYPGLRWLLSPKMSYEQAESMWRLATAPESTTLRDIDFTFYGLQPTERYHTYNFNESMLFHAQEKAQAQEADDINQQLHDLEARIRGTTIAADPDENDEEDSQAGDHQSPPEWQDLGEYVPLV